MERAPFPEKTMALDPLFWLKLPPEMVRAAVAEGETLMTPALFWKAVQSIKLRLVESETWMVGTYTAFNVHFIRIEMYPPQQSRKFCNFAS